MPIVFRSKQYIGYFILLFLGFSLVFAWQLGLLGIFGSVLAPVRSAAATPFEILLSCLNALGIALFLTMVLHFWEQEHQKVTSGAKVSGFMGIILALVALLCPVCNLGLLLLFGITLNFQFLAPYFWLFQLLATFFLAVTVYFMHKRIEEGCALCVESPKK